MFTRLELENFGIFDRFEWNDHADINIIIGENDTGKTYILKTLYCIAKSVEDYDKLSAVNTWKQIIADKLFWVFQPSKTSLGSLVRRDGERLMAQASVWENDYFFEFGKDTKNTIVKATDSSHNPNNYNAIFIPPKEVLTAKGAIKLARDRFGFDQTYYDLIDAIEIPISLQTGLKAEELRDEWDDALDLISAFFGGDIALGEGGDFTLTRDRETYSMAEAAEGIKKLASIVTLIRNQRIRPGTVLFFDEPENNLHPRAILALCKAIFHLSQENTEKKKKGVQIYLATHSYFVIKQFEILARKYNKKIQICSLSKSQGSILSEFRDLQNGLPDNPIIDASIQLYEDDVRLELEA
jgi:AAA15 family ATPase/GTPase